MSGGFCCFSQLNSCCYSRISLPLGSSLIGFIYLVTAIVSGPDMLTALGFYDERSEFVSTGQQIAEMVFQEWMVLRLLQGFTAIVLVIGIEWEKPSLMLPFVRVMVVSAAHAIFVWHLAAFTSLAHEIRDLPPLRTEYKDGSRLPPEMAFCFDALLSIYAYAVVKSYRNNLRQSANQMTMIGLV